MKLHREAKSISVAVGLIGAILGVCTASIAEEWQMLTDMRDIRDLIVTDDEVWCATGGGLAIFDLSSETFRQLTTIDGLGGIGLRRLAADTAGGFWLGFENNAVQYLEPGYGMRYSVFSLRDGQKIDRLNDMLADRRGVFIATNIGVARLTYQSAIDRWVWLENYTQLGSLPMEEPVSCILIDGDDIWAGTSKGVARGDLNSPLPLTWTNYDRWDGLGGDTLRSLVKYAGTIYAASEGGLASWNGGGWSLLSNRSDILRLLVARDSLRALTSRSVLTWTGNAWLVNFTSADRLSSAGWDAGGGLWLGQYRSGISNGGLTHWADGDTILFQPPGPVTNKASAFGFTPDGDLLLVGGAAGGEYGLSIWNGQNWQIWFGPLQAERIFGYAHRAVLPDLDGGIWVGTAGGGMAHYNPDQTLTAYDASAATGSRLRGIAGAPNYVIASGLALDGEGNLWVLNRGADNGRVLVCVPRGFIQNPEALGEWYYFHRALFNNYDKMELITIDASGRKWLASNDPSVVAGQGVYAFDDRHTPADSSDDRVWGPITGLSSQQVFSLAYDPAGYIWVGSLDGAYYLDATLSNPAAGSFTQLYPLRQQAVNAIAIDRAGNKWFGTNDGAVIVDPDLFTVRRRIGSQPSDMLPPEAVNAIGINPTTGWAYLGTNLGTAALLTPYRDFGPRIQSVTVEPNPFHPGLGRMFFTGSSLARGASARIFTPDGRLVRRLSHEDAALGWDGRNDQGDAVADGVYIILTNNADGESAQGKVAVLRR